MKTLKNSEYIGNDEECLTAQVSSEINIIRLSVRNWVFLMQKAILIITSKNVFGAGQVGIMEALEEKFMKCRVTEETPLTQGSCLGFWGDLFSFLVTVVHRHF